MNLTPFLSSFNITALSELGDKTQLTVIALTAEYETIILLFFGVMFAFIVITGLIII